MAAIDEAGIGLEIAARASPLLPRQENQAEAEAGGMLKSFISQSITMVGATGIEPATPTMST
jgi:hypothetical protein